MGLASFNRARQKQAEAEKAEETQLEPKEENSEDFDIEELMENLENLKAPELKKLCEHFEIEYANKDEAILALSEMEF